MSIDRLCECAHQALVSDVRLKHEDRLREIVEAARALMIEEGAAALSLRGVAKRVGIKLASLQYHVEGKDALLDLVLDDAIARYTQVLKAYRDNRRDSPRKVLHDAVAWLVTQDESWEAFTAFEIQLWSLAEIEPRARQALDAYLGLYQGFLLGLVARARPDLDRSAQTARALALASLIEGASLVSRAKMASGARKRFAADIVQAALAIADA